MQRPRTAVLQCRVRCTLCRRHFLLWSLKLCTLHYLWPFFQFLCRYPCGRISGRLQWLLSARCAEHDCIHVLSCGNATASSLASMLAIKCWRLGLQHRLVEAHVHGVTICSVVYLILHKLVGIQPAACLTYRSSPNGCASEQCVWAS